MGGSTSSPTDWDAHTTTRTAGKSTAAIFRSTNLHESLDPTKIKVRESRDSDACPNATPIAVFLDVTGSMTHLLDYMIRTGLPTLIREIYDRKPVPDPHILFGAVGDVRARSRAPLQASQFEADIVLIEQLSQIWLEGGGGGNFSESYTLPWYFAAMKTSTDHFEKRGKKGYLFTIGDDGPPDSVTAAEFEQVFGPGEYQDMTSAQIYDLVTRTYNVYHIMVEQGTTHRETDVTKWEKLIGEHAIRLSDHTALSETIVSILQVANGADIDTVTKSWSGDKSLVIGKALGSLAKTSTVSDGGAVVEF